MFCRIKTLKNKKAKHNSFTVKPDVVENSQHISGSIVSNQKSDLTLKQ